MTSLNIKNAETAALVREMAKEKGTSITEAVHQATVRELERMKIQNDDTFVSDILAIARRYAAYPVTDPREPDDMLYDENGLPK